MHARLARVNAHRYIIVSVPDGIIVLQMSHMNNSQVECEDTNVRLAMRQ